MPRSKKLYILLAVLLMVTVLGLLLMTIRYNQVFNDANKAVEHTVAPEPNFNTLTSGMPCSD